MSDYKKLQAFVEAALSNPRHPIYAMGYSKHPMLQHYAINVTMLETIKPEEWFKEYPQHTAVIEELVKACEEETTIKEALPPQAGATGGAAPNPMQMLTEIYGMLKQMFDSQQQDAAQNKGETGQGGSSGAGGANG